MRCATKMATTINPRSRSNLENVTANTAYDSSSKRRAYEKGLVRGLVLGYVIGIACMIFVWALKILEDGGHL